MIMESDYEQALDHALSPKTRAEIMQKLSVGDYAQGKYVEFMAGKVCIGQVLSVVATADNLSLKIIYNGEEYELNAFSGFYPSVRPVRHCPCCGKSNGHEADCDNDRHPVEATKAYKPIPVEAAKRIALEFDKQQVVIIAVDNVHNQYHTTTYGISAEDKVTAANMGEFLTRQLPCDTTKSEFNEDFRRDFDAAKYKQARELLRASLNHGPLSPTGYALETKTAIEKFLAEK